MLRALIVAAVLAVPAVAYPCMNEVMLQGNEAVKYLAKVDRFLESGLNRKAQYALEDHVFEEPRLQQRAADYKAVIAMRVASKPGKVSWVVRHFEARTKASPKDMRVRAWLGEAYAASGNLDGARKVLVDLETRDLMPDAHAYAALARVTTGGDRELALAECQKRAKAKAICALPAEPVAAKPRS